MEPIRRNENYREATGEEPPCIICGRPIIDEDAAHWIHVGNGGSHAVTEAEAAADPTGDLGFYPVGPHCWRRHPELYPYESA